jgi:hypothetical protein
MKSYDAIKGDNDFKKEEVRNSKQWKLWVAFKTGSPLYYANIDRGGKKTYYNYDENIQQNLVRLVQNCFNKNQTQIQAAILYNNWTDEIIEKIK